MSAAELIADIELPAVTQSQEAITGDHPRLHIAELPGRSVVFHKATEGCAEIDAHLATARSFGAVACSWFDGARNQPGFWPV